MLGVHINPILDFREHFLYITKDVRKLARTLAKRNLSPNLKTIAIEQLLKSKYHATHLGVFNERQLTTIDGILNKALRQALGLLPDVVIPLGRSHAEPQGSSHKCGTNAPSNMIIKHECYKVVPLHL